MSALTHTQAATDLTETEAREVVNRIRQMVDIAWTQVTKAYQGRAWLALGYATWDEMCDAEFDTRIRLPREERREVVASLSEAGMSTRAIGAAIGVDPKTVRNDLASPPTGVTNVEPTIGLDGKRYAKPTKKPEASPTAFKAADPLTILAATERNVKGTPTYRNEIGYGNALASVAAAAGVPVDLQVGIDDGAVLDLVLYPDGHPPHIVELKMELRTPRQLRMAAAQLDGYIRIYRAECVGHLVAPSVDWGAAAAIRDAYPHITVNDDIRFNGLCAILGSRDRRQKLRERLRFCLNDITGAEERRDAAREATQRFAACDGAEWVASTMRAKGWQVFGEGSR